MSKTVKQLCENLLRAYRQDNRVYGPFREIIITNKDFIIENLRQIYLGLLNLRIENLYDKYLCIGFLSHVVYHLEYDLSQTPLSPQQRINTAILIDFAMDFLLEWNSLDCPGIPFSEWEDLCQEGLDLFVDLLDSPKRQKNFLIDDKFDQFKDKFSKRYHALYPKYSHLIPEWR